jgi:hypothetical protein
MKIIRSILSIIFFLSCFNNYGQFTDQINTNRPGESMGAYSVGKKVYQIEGGFYAVKENHKKLAYDATGFGIDIAARAGLFYERLEFILESQIQFDQYTDSFEQYNRSGLRQTLLGAKFLFYDPYYKMKEEKPNIMSWKANKKFKWKTLIPSMALYAGVNYVANNKFSIPNEATISPKVMLLFQNQFNQGYVLVTNLVADKIASKTFNYGYVITLTKGFSEKWTGFIENKGIKGDYYSDGIFRVGATYLLKQNLQFDASISKNIKNTPSFIFGGLGVSWRLEKKHKEYVINGGSDGKKTDSTDTKAKEREEEVDKLIQQEDSINRLDRSPEDTIRRLDGLEENIYEENQKSPNDSIAPVDNTEPLDSLDKNKITNPEALKPKKQTESPVPSDEDSPEGKAVLDSIKNPEEKKKLDKKPK